MSTRMAIEQIENATKGEELRSGIIEALESLAASVDDDGEVTEKITPYMSEIRSAIYGEEVRAAIVNSLRILAEEIERREASGDYEPYRGEYIVIPKATQQTLETDRKVMFDDVEVKPVPYGETSNQHGTTISILS